MSSIKPGDKFPAGVTFRFVHTANFLPALDINLVLIYDNIIVGFLIPKRSPTLPPVDVR